MAREWALFTKVTAPMRKVEDRCIPGPRGPIPIRTYTPHTRHSDPLPVLVYFHGGGWIYGSIEAVDRAVRLMANEAQAIVINVEYRLAPEHPWPAAHDDAEAAFLWARENAESLGGHPAMVGVGGDSAGGNLCVSVANRQIQAGRPPPLYQLLYYNAPSFSPDCESARLFSNGYVFDTVFRDFMLSRVYPGEGTAERAAQELRAVSLTQMPATIMVTAGFDMLRDGGRSFARKLEEHGVPVTYLHYPSLIHGLLQWSGVVTDAEHAAELSARVLGVAIRSRLAMLR
jgi:acetyl esterase/lipase